jgi:hypothetical protein
VRGAGWRPAGVTRAFPPARGWGGAMVTRRGGPGDPGGEPPGLGGPPGRGERARWGREGRSRWHVPGPGLRPRGTPGGRRAAADETQRACAGQDAGRERPETAWARGRAPRRTAPGPGRWPARNCLRTRSSPGARSSRARTPRGSLSRSAAADVPGGTDVVFLHRAVKGAPEPCWCVVSRLRMTALVLRWSGWLGNAAGRWPGWRLAGLGGLVIAGEGCGLARGVGAGWRRWPACPWGLGSVIRGGGQAARVL